MKRFYVYEHLRKGSGVPFYVGKGSGDRIKSKQGRNQYWHNIVKKYGGYTNKLVIQNVDEELAHLAEMERIDQYRRLGLKLANITDGGEGTSGYIYPTEVREAISKKQRGQVRPSVSAALKGIPKSKEHRKSLSLARIGSKVSESTKAKMSKTRKGRPSAMLGKKHSQEAKKKISNSLRGEKNPFYGKTHSEESIRLIRLANIEKKDSMETRRKKSLARIGDKNPNYGRVTPEEQKARQRETLSKTLAAKPRYECPHCGKHVFIHVLKKWHLDNCKEKK